MSTKIGEHEPGKLDPIGTNGLGWTQGERRVRGRVAGCAGIWLNENWPLDWHEYRTSLVNADGKTDWRKVLRKVETSSKPSISPCSIDIQFSLMRATLTESRGELNSSQYYRPGERARPWCRSADHFRIIEKRDGQTRILGAMQLDSISDFLLKDLLQNIGILCYWFFLFGFLVRGSFAIQRKIVIRLTKKSTGFSVRMKKGQSWKFASDRLVRTNYHWEKCVLLHSRKILKHVNAKYTENVYAVSVPGTYIYVPFRDRTNCCESPSYSVDKICLCYWLHLFQYLRHQFIRIPKVVVFFSICDIKKL